MTDRLTDFELNAIRERLAAATPGPWRAEYSGITGPVVVDAESIDARDHVARCPHYRGQADTDFIAHAPTDVAALLAEVERLRAGWAAAIEAVTDGLEVERATACQEVDPNNCTDWCSGYCKALDDIRALRIPTEGDQQ